MSSAETNEPAKITRLITIPDVEARTRLSRSTIYRYVRKGVFPRPFQVVAGGAVRWSEASVDAWIEAKAAVAGTSPSPV